MRVIYFGCVGDCGHNYYLPSGSHLSRAEREKLPWKDYETDGLLCPGNRWTSHFGGRWERPTTQVEGSADIHHKDGWTALAFWDRSIDGRPGSNSVFLIEGIHDFAGAVAAAKLEYPAVWRRFNFEVKLAT